MQSLTPAEEFSQREGQFDIEIDVKHNFLGDTGATEVYAKRMAIPAGIAVGKHVHDHDHVSVLAKGRVRVDSGVDAIFYAAPAHILVRAGLHHRITAIEDSVWYCIHAADVDDETTIDKELTNAQ